MKQGLSSVGCLTSIHTSESPASSGRAASSECHGPQAQVDNVTAGAAEDEHGHIAPYPALLAEQTGHKRDQDEDMQANARNQK